jgi:hypothetical protein
MAWLDDLYRTHGDAAGIHYVKGHDVMADGVPDVVRSPILNHSRRMSDRLTRCLNLQSHPYWAHCVKDYRLLTREQAQAVCPGMTQGSAFETIIYKPA